MQNHAYSVTFSPIPNLSGESVYFDKAPIPLPDIDTFHTLHYHDCYEVGICESGEGLFLFEDEVFYVSEGDALFISPRSRHYSRSLHASTPCLCRFVYIDESEIRELLLFLTKDENKVGQILTHARRLLSPILPRGKHLRETALLCDLVRACAESQSELRAMTMLRLTLFLLQTQTTVSPEPANSLPYQTDTAILAVAEYIATHYDSNDPVEALARFCSLSQSQLRRRFLRVYGIPPITYRNQVRCKIASALLLQSEMSVCEIASRVGFADVSDFYRAFRKFYSTSPTAYRRQTHSPHSH